MSRIKSILKKLVSVFVKEIFWRKNKPIAEINKVAILYFIALDSKKNRLWSDGFTSAIDFLKDDFYDFHWINLAQEKPTKKELELFDLVLVKSNWNWIPDMYCRKVLRGSRTPRGLLISGVNPAPIIYKQCFYQILWYETFWYKNQISMHPNTFHAFGIDTETFTNLSQTKDYDFVTVGGFVPHKRHDLFMQLIGKKAAIGDMSFDTSKEIVNTLKKNKVDVFDFSNQGDLNKLLNKSHTLCISAGINGGGERAVLEARSSGTNVKLLQKNSKLTELLTSPIWSSNYYAFQLLKGIKSISHSKINNGSNLIESNRILSAGYLSYHRGDMKILGDQYIEIGNYCSFGNNVKFITSNHDYNFPSLQGTFYKTNFNQKHPGELPPYSNARTKGPITVGHDVWIGDNVTILSGVSIGHGAIIGTGSIVTKNVANYSIVGGNPAKHIKGRYSEEIVTLMLKLKWWNWSPKKIKANQNFFNSNLNELSMDEINEILV